MTRTAVFAGRIDVLYALGRHYLSLPFAVLCVPATLIAGHAPGVLPLMPLLLQMAVVIAAEQLTTAYKNRTAGSDPHFWARRYTFVSAISGATWGVASLFWFVLGLLSRPGLSGPGLSGHDGDRIHRPLGPSPRLYGPYRLRAGAAGRAAAVAGRALCRHAPPC